MIARPAILPIAIAACLVYEAAVMGACADMTGAGDDPAAIEPAELELPEMFLGPMLRHPEAFGPGGSLLVDRFETLIRREAFLPGPTDPCRFVEGLVECLRDESLPAADLARTLHRLVRLVIPFEPERSRALDRVRAIAPEAFPASRSVRSDGGEPAPASGPRTFTMVEWIDSAGSPFGGDLLPPKAWEPPVVPGSVVPPQLCITHLAPRDFPETREVDADIEVELRGGTDGGDLVFADRSTRKFTLAGSPRAVESWEIDLSIPPAERRPAGAIDAKVTCRIVERDPEGHASPLEIEMQDRFRLLEVDGPDGCQAFRVVPLDDDGREFPRPELVDPVVAMAFRPILFYAKGPFRDSMIAKARSTRARHGSLGASLEGIDLAWDRAAGGPGRLMLPAEGRILVVLGAGWCGPCRELAPTLDAYATFLRERGIDERIVRLSIEDDDELPAHVADEHFACEFPDGIVAKAQQETLGIDSVPRYLVVEEGRVVESDVLSADVIDRFMSRRPP